MQPSQLRGLHEAYNEVYAENEDLIIDNLIEEIVEELIQECVEFGYELDESADVVEEATIQYLMELNPYAAAGSKEARAYAKSTTATKRGEERKAAISAAKERVKAKVKGAAAGAGIAASIAKDEARRAGRAAAHAVSSAVQKKKEEVKSGVKSLLGKGLRKAAGAVGKVAQKAAGAASRLGEEVQQLDEISDKKVQQVVNARNRRFARSNPDAPNREFHQAVRSNKLAARRNQRTGSNVHTDSDIDGTRGIRSREETSRMREIKVNKESVELDTWDLVLEYLITNGHADTNAEALYVMSQLDENAVQSIIEEVLDEKKGERPQGLPYGPVGKGFRQLTIPQRAEMIKKGKKHTRDAMASSDEYSGSHAKSSAIDSALRSRRLGGRG